MAIKIPRASDKYTMSQAVNTAKVGSTVKKNLAIPNENFVIFHHTGETFIIPVDPNTISDQMGATFNSSTPLSRSAPIYSYSGSGPRTVGVNFTLHRDLCNEYNTVNSSVDAVDRLITNLDGMVLPDYQETGKIVNPPVISLKIRDEIYIKGVVSNTSHSYQLPIINYNGSDKYAVVELSFSIQEVTPYSASILPKYGQFRS